MKERNFLPNPEESKQPECPPATFRNPASAYMESFKLEQRQAVCSSVCKCWLSDVGCLCCTIPLTAVYVILLHPVKRSQEGKKLFPFNKTLPLTLFSLCPQPQHMPIFNGNSLISRETRTGIHLVTLIARSPRWPVTLLNLIT